jgi:hypothetical protein
MIDETAIRVRYFAIRDQLDEREMAQAVCGGGEGCGRPWRHDRGLASDKSGAQHDYS